MNQVLAICRRLATSQVIALGDKKYVGRFTTIHLDEVEVDDIKNALTSEAARANQSECCRLAQRFL